MSYKDDNLKSAIMAVGVVICFWIGVIIYFTN
jgi:hypothetical protein